MGCRAYKTLALSRRRKVAYHAGKKESLVGLAAAAARCMVGGTGGGLPLAAGHEDNGSAGCAEQRTGRAVCVGVEPRQPALFAGVYGDLRGGGYRGSYRPEEYPPRRGASAKSTRICFATPLSVSCSPTRISVSLQWRLRRVMPNPARHWQFIRRFTTSGRTPSETK